MFILKNQFKKLILTVQLLLFNCCNCSTAIIFTMKTQYCPEQIHDDDSITCFELPTFPFKQACGYSFCSKSDISTRNDDSEYSQKLSRSNSSKSIIECQSDPSIHEKMPLFFQDFSFTDQINLIEKLYEEHKIDEAYEESCKFKKMAEKFERNLFETQKKLFSKIEQEMKDVLMYEKILYQDGWKLQKDKKNLKISSKIQGNTVGVLVEAYLQVQYFLQVIIEFDLMRKFMPFMDTSRLEKAVARNCRIAHCINDFPIIAKRESFFQGIGYDRLKHNNTIFMYTRSLHDRQDLQEQLGYKVVQTKDAVQLDYKYFVLQYTPDSLSGGFLKLAINTDLKLSIPMFLLEPASKGFGEDFYKNIRKIAKNFNGSEWQKKMLENPNFFELVKGRIQDHFGGEKQEKMNRRSI